MDKTKEILLELLKMQSEVINTIGWGKENLLRRIDKLLLMDKAQTKTIEAQSARILSLEAEIARVGVRTWKIIDPYYTDIRN